MGAQPALQGDRHLSRACTPHLDLSKATDEVLLLLATWRSREANEEIPQEAATQAHFIAADGDKDRGWPPGPCPSLEPSSCLSRSPKPQQEGIPIPRWTRRSVGKPPETWWSVQGPPIPPVLGFLNTGPLTPQVPTTVWLSHAGDSTGRRGTHRWTQPPWSCWPQRPTHLASLVGGTRRGRGMCLDLISAQERDMGLEREPTGGCPRAGEPRRAGW